jgi:UMF1 family MFS transporter
MGIIVMNGIGGLCSGRVGDKIGIKQTLLLALLVWMIALPLLAISSSLIMVIIIALVLGFCIGTTQAMSRAYMSLLVEKEHLGYGFSFYTIFERFAAVL